MALGLAIGIVIDLGGVLAQGEVAPVSSDNGGDGVDGRDSGGFSISLPSVSSTLDCVAVAVGGYVDARGMVRVPFRHIPRALKFLRSAPFLLPGVVCASSAEQAEKSFLHSLAFYVGPILEWKFVYVTVGACLGGFGCLAGGGGLMFGRFGIGVLVPFWKWWGDGV